jgi:hypothetical protein
MIEAAIGMTDCEFILRLIEVAAAYDNKTPCSFPQIFVLLPYLRDGRMPAGLYNSNSYVAGVLAGAGATPPALRLPTRPPIQMPGYDNPLPIRQVAKP